MILRKRALQSGFWSAMAVAIFTVCFIVSLPLTFMPNLSAWAGIDAYAHTFKPMQMFTVFPSIILAASYMILNVSIYYYADAEKKIWSHMSIVFGLMYATISSMNYLIQIITVIPSMINNQPDGLEAFAAGNSNSVFYALMASYFFMCISALFISFVFSYKDKDQKIIRILFVGTGISGPLCLLGAIVPIFMPIAGVLWFVCLTTGSIKIALYFRKLLTSIKNGK